MTCEYLEDESTGVSTKEIMLEADRTKISQEIKDRDDLASWL